MTVVAHLTTIVDGDGHVLEDLPALAEFLPAAFGEPGPFGPSRLFPPLDHLHGQPVKLLPDAFGGGKPVGLPEWRGFMEFTGIRQAVLYPTWGLAYGRIVNPAWAVAVCRAYNDWLYASYLSQDPRLHGMALIPLQEPASAVIELRRVVRELGFRGAMLPTNGLKGHLGSAEFWPVYEEAAALGCALATHSGAHGEIGLDYLNPYAGVHALGHPFSTMVSFTGMVLNGIFDRFDGLRVAFLEGGVAWFLMMLERLDRSYDTHVPYDPRGEFIRLRDGEHVSEYIKRKVGEGQIFVGCEGEEPTLAYAVREVGHQGWIFSSDYPHEVSPTTCKHEIDELLETDELSPAAKEAILAGNAQRLYGLSLPDAPERPVPPTRSALGVT
jgi:predicted TIM-barrel fold metal-dependent hydrolase